MPSSAILTMIPGTLTPQTPAVDVAVTQFRRAVEEFVTAVIRRGTQ